MATASRDSNFVPTIQGVSTVDGTTPTNIKVNPSTGAMQAEVTGAGSGGTSSVDHATFTAGSSAGTAAMGVYQATPSTLTDGQLGIASLTSDRALRVSIVSGSSSGTQYAEGATAATATGTLSMAKNGTALKSLLVDSSSNLLVSLNTAVPAGTNYMGKVRLTDGTNDTTLRSLTNTKALDVAIVDGSGNQITSFGGGTQYANAAAQATPTGTVSLGWDGANVRALSTSNAGVLKVDNSANTQPVSGTVTANIGTSGSLALDATLTGGTQQTKITDGTNVASVKAASTAAVATDKAVVVAVSPNNSVAVTGTFWQSTQPVSGTVMVQQSTASSLKVDLSGTAANATAIKVDGSAVTQPVSGTFWQATQPVSLASLPALASGTNTIGNTVPVPSATSTGLSIFNNNALSNTATAVKASAGNLYGYHFYNPNSATIFIQVWNLGTGSVTVGTTAPTMVLAVPGLGALDTYLTIPVGFSTAITVAATTTATGSTAPGTALVANAFYI